MLLLGGGGQEQIAFCPRIWSLILTDSTMREPDIFARLAFLKGDSSGACVRYELYTLVK